MFSGGLACLMALFGIATTPGCSDSDSDSPRSDASAVFDGSRDVTTADADASNEAATLSDATETDGAIPSPMVSGKITGGRHGSPYNAMPASMATQAGYVEEEFFITGSARSYQPTGDFESDGRWPAKFSTQAPYTTRFIVRRPADPQRFNGTVIVEWLNVSAGRDSDPDFGFAHEELFRGGYAYVAVSAQKVGIDGGSVIVTVPGVTVQALKEWDPERYGSLSHPGDDYSYDMFAQVAVVLRHPGAIDPMAGLTPKHVIAVGESQSAFRLFTFVAAVHPLTHVYDGFLIHSRSAAGTPLNSSSTFKQAASARVRTDLNEPVLQFITETDLFALNFLPSRQPDTGHIVTWEVAGTAHADQATLDYGAASAGASLPDAGLDLTSICGKVNSGPQQFVLRKAIDSLNRWVVDGTLPGPAAPLEVETTDTGPALVHDAHGNARGGVRTPLVDVPIAAFSGQGRSSGGLLCALFGTTTPLSDATLKSLYPTHTGYVNLVSAAAQAAVDAGHLLPADQALLVSQANAAPIPP
jgi:hypothetical protein